MKDGAKVGVLLAVAVLVLAAIGWYLYPRDKPIAPVMPVIAVPIVPPLPVFVPPVAPPAPVVPVVVQVTPPPVIVVVKRVNREKPAYDLANRNKQRAECLQGKVDAKIDADIKLRKITDKGPGLEWTGCK